MKKNRLKNEVILSVFLLIGFHCFSQFSRQKYNFNSDWKLHVGDVKNAESSNFNDVHWRNITLPRAFNQEEAFKLAIDELTTSVSWYRKTFKLPENTQDKKVFIEFEGVRMGGEVYVNGKYVGIHENGAMAFGFDITEFVNYNSTNVIAVRLDNDWKYREKTTGATFRWNDKNFNANYGGIPKNVYLHITDKLYQTLPLYSNLKTIGVYVYATNFDIPDKEATINVTSQIKNEFDTPKAFTFLADILDLEGNKVAQFSKDGFTIQPNETIDVSIKKKISNLHFWSWGYGYLYTVKSKIIMQNQDVDEVATTTGFRKTEFKNGMVYLNDRVLQMKGYAQRTSNEWPAVGMSVPAWLSDYSNRLMVEGNANLVRWMHITPWKQDVESCDRVGLIQAMPAGDSERDSSGRNWEQRTELMRDAIIYNRNNPSIIFYESGNEVISEPHMYEMKSIRNTYDPYGGRAIGSREMLDSREAEYGGEMLYINKSARIPMWATEYSRDEGLRLYWDEYSPPFHKEGTGGTYAHNVNGSKVKDASSYNHNQDAHAIENVVRWFDYYECRPGTGERVSSGGVNIIFSDTNTHFRGAENYRRSGETDPMRIPKDGFFAHQVMWDGWVDIEKHRTHILGHWNYTKTVVKDMYVVSSGAQVELFVNGVSKGFGERSYEFLFTFKDIPWESGEIKAISYDAQGKVLSEDVNTTAGAPHAIKLTQYTSPAGFLANGADLAMVQVEVVDKNGQRCPVDNSMIEFSLKGDATYLGGIAKGPNNFILSEKLPVELGVNRVLIRSGLKAGDISLTAKSKGLKTAKLTLQTVPFESQNGLSAHLPGAGLPSNLSRGETPNTPSYNVKRVNAFIRSAKAGAHQETVYFSFDDNELTEWTNDGMVKNGWIEYQLAKPSVVNQCVIKLTGWRTKQYPIRILADGEEVYRGLTSQSLGYITLDLKPVRAQHIRIELMGENTEKDGFSEIVEVDPTKDLDLFKDEKAANAKGQLRIVEVEFYTNPNVD